MCTNAAPLRIVGLITSGAGKSSTQANVMFKAIARVIGATERATFHMLAKGELPARQVGQRWVASRTKLREHFEEVANV